MSKREQILTAALKLFMENGFEKTPTSAISKVAEVATGTLFHHFKTKEDLISTLYFEIKMEVRDHLFSDFDETADLKVNLQGTAVSMVDWSLENPDKFQFLAQFGESSLIPSNTRERVEAAFESLNILLQKGAANNTFHDVPEELMLRLMSAHLFAGVGYLLENPESWQNATLRSAFLESFWNIIAKVDHKE
ncbi:TetR/AcrR family transcriptional regulator [Sansalvadorimonas verongulae]|uniref:TetR/AcrR family transcriptional regulator n=1 Tax=Sansalvadorimonas verongulae TaxID=2172824 RepID=UPI0018AD101E|nr:TetR/AcrR family transcriptional regulator [Sansalvadorimonas verongulae]